MGGGAQRPVWCGNELKKTGACSAGARTRGQNPLVLYILITIKRDKLKGIDPSFELRGEIRLNRFVRTNWRLGIFLNFILKGHLYKISKKPIDAA
jgi:hypothetical protein